MDIEKYKPLLYNIIGASMEVQIRWAKGYWNRSIKRHWQLNWRNWVFLVY
mgnify:CR=1 FL=1